MIYRCMKTGLYRVVMIKFKYYRFPGNQETTAVRKSYLATLVILLLLSTLPPIAHADGTKQITVLYLYDESCQKCTEAMPVVRQAVEEVRNEGISVDYREVRVNSREGALFVDRFCLMNIPDLIIDNHTIVGPSNLEGEYGTVLRNVKDTIVSSYGYALPVIMHTTAEKKGEKDSNVTVTVYISNQGNTPINASLLGGLTEGSRLTSGKFYWKGLLKPNTEEKITYALSGGNTSYVSPSILYYEDKLGSHIVTGSYEPVSTIPTLSFPFAFASGILAAFNPCIIAVIAYMSTLAAPYERRYLLLLNVTVFSAGLLITYSLIGICFYEISVVIPSVNSVARYATIATMFILGTITMFRAFFRYGHSLSDAGFKKLVLLLRPYNRIHMAGFSFVMGLGFGLIKMPCVGGPYLAILGSMADQNGSFQRLYYLLAYYVGIVLPVLGLGVLLATGLSARRLDAIRMRYRVTLNMAMGFTLFILATLLAFNII